jgi:hypothetical protein
MTDGAALDASTPIGEVRLLTGDSVQTEGKYRYWSDAELTVFLKLGSGNIHLAAAQAYTQLATSISLAQGGNRTYRTEDLNLGGLGPGGDIRLIAREWRYLAEQTRQVEAEDYAEFVAGPTLFGQGTYY